MKKAWVREVVKNTILAMGLALSLFVIADASKAAELQPETLNAWNNYIQTTQARMISRLSGNGTFLWVDENPARAQRVREGQVEVAPIGKRGAESVPNGLIHDWIGTAFIPNASVDQVLGTVRDYRRYKDYFNPQVIDSQLITHSDESDQFSIRWMNKVLFVSAGMDTLCRFENVRVGHRRSYSTSYTTSVQEIQNFGQPNERKLAPDQGDGFIWRLYSITRYEERDGGVYLEIEALALTRDIPGSLRFLVSPVVKRLSRNSLLLSLTQTRAAVRTTTEISNRVVAGVPAGRNAHIDHAMSLR